MQDYILTDIRVVFYNVCRGQAYQALNVQMTLQIYCFIFFRFRGKQIFFVIFKTWTVVAPNHRS